MGGNKKFQLVVENDNLKNEYCLTHNIKLIRLSCKDIIDKNLLEI
jgi:hypothetical protein